MQETITQTYQQNRSRLIGLAYRMTGSSAEAEDIVNEVFIKLSEQDISTIDNIDAWVFRATTNLCLDHLKSAKVTRETYIGPWLPEPFQEEKQNPDRIHELDQSLSIAFMLVLERLSPKERVSYILHDIFHFSFDDIANMVDESASACRKQASRARSKLGKNVIHQELEKHEQKKYAQAFFDAVKHGDTEALTDLLVADAVFYSDSGGKAAASLKVLTGAADIAKFFKYYVAKSFLQAESNRNYTFTEYNGAVGLIIKEEGKVISGLQFIIEDGKISQIYAHRNPDKLKYISLH
ncbi:RNA polymerase sigma factor SigJ [Teredinibacter sp. KSP-S5-2]|uniref:RNA polymerase sigma factor SigJ n=1 Tax=Teredinibacter sp. KSP-S5-2 TaxID=3034506 RepID=UPI002934260B|nr:RNA polymerase sigma factor SigJ [Teredinibacter sp. KSP-S5-2]WNO07522.1 RNA polymerase sigma factor SigJ [Teredinibacter sp. KSP-S5-2]